jgi:diguanylate cyclase (GGDEF)-like protein/PAS domain S-box-containing protein
MLKEDRERLAFQEALYRNIFQQIPVGIILREGKEIATNAKSISINSMAKFILGRSEEELMNLTWPEITHEEDLEIERPLYERFAKGEIYSYSMEKRLIKPDGSTIWAHVKVADFSENAPKNSMYLCLLEDISARKRSEEALRESERSKSVFLSHLPGMAYRCKYDQDWTMEFVSDGCYALTGYKSENLIANRKISYNSIIAPEHREFLWREWERVLLQRKRFQGEYKIITKAGEYKWVLELRQGVYDAEGNIEALEGIVLDISEQKEKEYEITYLREHDFLTGLYNRSYMEQEKRRLDNPEYWPLSVFICDIDGLRMINDAYSHAEGDRLILKAAKLIQSCLKKGAVMGRITGGEFMLLLPNTDSQAAHRIKTNIKDVIAKYNNSKKDKLYAVNLTIGYSTKGTKDQNIEDIIKDAEEYLKHSKLLNRNSSHSAIVSAIMATLYAKSQETEDHGQRLGRYCQMIGRQLGLDQKSMSELYLVSKLHDIGKIGIDDSILNKPGKLSGEEWAKMKLHPEIGHRIAMATPQLEHIAEYILYHHEHWDGTGYPRGLKGEDIPVISRILAIADAFDAMTEDRVYRKALPKEVALAEIKRNAGTQFDPKIAKIFIDLMKEEILMAAAR